MFLTQAERSYYSLFKTGRVNNVTYSNNYITVTGKERLNFVRININNQFSIIKMKLFSKRNKSNQINFQSWKITFI